MEETIEITTHAYDTAIAEDPYRDENAKELLQDIQIFALVLKKTFSEYKPFSIQEIASRIQYFKGVCPDPADPEAFLDKSVDLSNPEVITPDGTKTIYDNLVVIQDMVTDQLYFVHMEVNSKTLPPEILVNRDLSYLAREIYRQRSDPYGMKKNYVGLKAVKSLWILPISSRLGILKKRFVTEYIREEDDCISTVRSRSEMMIDSRIVFLNEGWHNSGDGTIQALGHLFDSDRKKAIDFMEREGVKMTRTIEAATENYYDHHFRTLNRRDRKAALEAQKQIREYEKQNREYEKQNREYEKQNKEYAQQNKEYQQILARKDTELSETRTRLYAMEKALAAALARLAEYEK